MDVEKIVEASGVSRSTVFRFLRGDNVRDKVKENIIFAMSKLGYSTSAVNNQMDLEIEISTSGNLDQFLGLTQVLKGITHVAERKGIKINIVTKKTEQIAKSYENISPNNIGVIVIGKDIRDEDVEAKILVDDGIPHIFINRIFEDYNVSYVAVDLKKAGYDITKLMIQQGYTKISICGNCGNLRADRDKIAGYKMAMAEHNLPISGLCREDVPKENMDQVLQEFAENADAFIGICDTFTMKFLEIARSLNKSTKAVGMDDVAFADILSQQFTTVHIPFYEMGKLAVECLLKQREDSIKSTKIILNHYIKEIN